MKAKTLKPDSVAAWKILCRMCQDRGLPEPYREYEFHYERQWRLDYAWPIEGLALEVNGGVWIRGGHNRGSGYVKDMEKYNALACMGYRLLIRQPKEFLSQETIELIYRALYA